MQALSRKANRTKNKNKTRGKLLRWRLEPKWTPRKSHGRVLELRERHIPTTRYAIRGAGCRHHSCCRPASPQDFTLPCHLHVQAMNEAYLHSQYWHDRGIIYAGVLNCHSFSLGVSSNSQNNHANFNGCWFWWVFSKSTPPQVRTTYHNSYTIVSVDRFQINVVAISWSLQSIKCDML